MNTDKKPIYDYGQPLEGGPDNRTPEQIITNRAKVRRKNVLYDVDQERERQNEKWGENADAEHTPAQMLAILTEEVGEVAQEINDVHFHNWDDENVGPLRKELVQVAAVAVKTVELIDTRTEALAAVKRAKRKAERAEAEAAKKAAEELEPKMVSQAGEAVGDFMENRLLGLWGLTKAKCERIAEAISNVRSKTWNSPYIPLGYVHRNYKSSPLSDWEQRYIKQLAETMETMVNAGQMIGATKILLVSDTFKKLPLVNLRAVEVAQSLNEYLGVLLCRPSVPGYITPLDVMKAVNELKGTNRAYGPNYIFSLRCPLPQGQVITSFEETEKDPKIKVPLYNPIYTHYVVEKALTETLLENFGDPLKFWTLEELTEVFTSACIEEGYPSDFDYKETIAGVLAKLGYEVRKVGFPLLNKVIFGYDIPLNGDYTELTNGKESAYEKHLYAEKVEFIAYQFKGLLDASPLKEPKPYSVEDLQKIAIDLFAADPTDYPLTLINEAAILLTVRNPDKIFWTSSMNQTIPEFAYHIPMWVNKEEVKNVLTKHAADYLSLVALPGANNRATFVTPDELLSILKGLDEYHNYTAENVKLAMLGLDMRFTKIGEDRSIAGYYIDLTFFPDWLAKKAPSQYVETWEEVHVKALLQSITLVGCDDTMFVPIWFVKKRLKAYAANSVASPPDFVLTGKAVKKALRSLGYQFTKGRFFGELTYGVTLPIEYIDRDEAEEVRNYLAKLRKEDSYAPLELVEQLAGYIRTMILPGRKEFYSLDTIRVMTEEAYSGTALPHVGNKVYAKALASLGFHPEVKRMDSGALKRGYVL